MTTVYSRRWFQAWLFWPKKAWASITASPSKKRRRSSYSILWIVCCGRLWQEIFD